ncbi:MAG: YceD family protein [Rhodanobacteraceae bacterium]
MDAERMVAGRRSFEGVLPVAELPRLMQALARDTGGVAYNLDFERGQLGGPELHVRLAARLMLECQRTLEPFEYPVEIDARLGLLASEVDAAALPESREPLLLEDGALQLHRVIEDELLLALPLVPVKPGSEMLQGEWNTSGQVPHDAETGEPVAHPFAGLKELLDARAKRH